MPMSNDELASATGSKKGYDPIPPDQYLAFLNSSDPPLQQLLAWLRSRTIRLGHRSPFAVDKNGRPLGIKDLAKDRSWHVSNAHRVWKEAEERGLVRMDDKKLYLCGSVEPKDGEESQPRPEPQPKDGIAGRLTSSQFDIFRKWSKEKRDSFESTMNQALEYSRKLQAEAIAAARAAAEELEDRIFEAHEMPKRRITKRRPEPEAIRVDILRAPETLFSFLHDGQFDAPGVDAKLCTKSDFRLCTKSVSLLSFRGVLQRGIEASSSEEVSVESEAEPKPANGRRRPTTESQTPKTIVPELLQTLAALRIRFSISDETTALRVFEAAAGAIQSVEGPRIVLSDTVLASAVIASNAQSPRQESPGLYLKTVPAILKTWAQSGIPDEPAKIPPVLVRKQDFADRMFDIGKRRYGGD